MNRQETTMIVGRILIGSSLTGLLGLVGLSGFFNPEYFRWSYLSYLSFLAYFRFFRAYYDPAMIPRRQVPALCFSMVIPSLAVNLAPQTPALGFLGFLGFYGLLVGRKRRGEATSQSA